jgi:hypothetical protein
MHAILLCQHCTQPFPVERYRLKKNPRFCSARCMGLAMRVPDETRVCVYCQQTFVVRKTQKERAERAYCSTTCNLRAYGAAKTARMFGEFWTRIARCDHEWLCLYCCWLWQGGVNQQGYGRFTHNGRQHMAHRVAWELLNKRTMSPSLHGAHYCHTPLCCNPLHIHAATAAENIAESVRDKRYAFGSHHRHTRLQEADIVEMFRLYHAGWYQTAIARHFRITPGNLRRILHRQTWKHVNIEPYT